MKRKRKKVVFHLSTGQTLYYNPDDCVGVVGGAKPAHMVKPGDAFTVIDPLGMGDFIGDKAYKTVNVLVVREAEIDEEDRPHQTDWVRKALERNSKEYAALPDIVKRMAQTRTRQPPKVGGVRADELLFTFDEAVIPLEEDLDTQPQSQQPQEGCKYNHGQHDFEFLRRETRPTKQWDGRTLEREVVDVFYCRHCIEYKERVIRREQPDPRGLSGWIKV